MRTPRQQLLIVAGVAALCVVSVVMFSVRLRARPPRNLYTGPQRVIVGSLQLPHNRSRFELPRGLEPYPWTFFLLHRWHRQVIVPGMTEVQRPPRQGPEDTELTTVQEAALAEVRHQTGNSAYSKGDALGGRYRVVPGDGVEYEVYVRSRDDTTPGAFHTVRLTRDFSPVSVRYDGETRARVVNIVLPYYNRLETLKRFVDRFVELVQSEQELTLTIVKYNDGFPSMDASQQTADRAGVADIVQKANTALGGVNQSWVRLVECEGRFSRGGALLAGAAAWDSSADVLLFLCDVDIVFGRSLLQRCRANAAPAARAYFPVVFSTYNPEIVYGVIKKKPVPVLTNYQRSTLIDRELGYWIDFGFGMSCQYLSDFRRLSGSFLNITGWGLEDVKLYEQFKKSEVEIVRMPDPDLVHVYHKKQCNKHEVGKRFNSCLKSKALNEASRLEWGLWVFKNMGDTDDVEEFLKMFASSQVARGR